MKPSVSVWIVTYNNREDLHNNLNSLLNNHDPSILDLDVNVINNHSNFNLDPVYWDKVKVWHNKLRSDASLGHLSRNWNQALINGFGNLDNPCSDIVVTSQDDVLWNSNWCELLVEAMSTHSLVTQGVGDAVVAYKIQAVRQIGLWDERFCPSFYHDGDYFLRALMYNQQYSSINDAAHGRLLNVLPYTFATVPDANLARIDAKNLSYGKASIPFAVWRSKWSLNPMHWTDDLLNNPPSETQCVNYIQYPHFETNLQDLAGRKYVI